MKNKLPLILLATILCCWLGASTKSRFMLTTDGTLQYVYPATSHIIRSAPTIQEAQRRLEAINGRALSLIELINIIRARASTLEANTQETSP